MRRRLLFVLLGLAACSTAEEVPPGMLPREKFTEVLMEAQLIEARRHHETVIDRPQPGDSTTSPVQQYYTEMFKTQGVSEEAFKSTYQWYVEHPEQLKEIYNDILTELQQRVDRADSTGTAH